MRRKPVVHIGVIDDDRDFLALMEDVLTDRGWDVTCCHDTLSALTLFTEQTLHAVVLDIRLETAQSGWDILTFLETHPRLANLPIVLCSGDVLELRERAAWLRNRGIRVLHKPFDLVELYDAIESALGRAEAATALPRQFMSTA